jgi:cytochrome P450
MRIYPMILGPLERHLGKPITIDGMVIPARVIASTAAIHQGQLDSVYPEPKLWKPERWIDADERMKLNWIPFGHGCRSRPGSSYDRIEIHDRNDLSKIQGNYTTKRRNRRISSC